jgi:hypothetical protein
MAGNHRLLLWMLMSLLLVAAGCEPASHIAWSPDGSHAAYFTPVQGKLLPGSGYLIDPSGKVLTPLGLTFGSYDWSADSKTVYFGGYDDNSPASDGAIRKWMIDAEDAAAVNANPTDEFAPMALNRWRDGKIEKLVSLRNRLVLFVHESPDQTWIAAVVFVKNSENDHGHAELFAFNTESKKLYELSDNCGFGACFTAPNKLAYVESGRDDKGSSAGQIVEVVLDESAQRMQRNPLVEVLWQKTTDLKAVEDGLLFTTVGRTFPANSASWPGDLAQASIYHFTRANGGLGVLSDSTSDLFLPSPDGKRILFLHGPPGKLQIAVMNANGSDPHDLRDIHEYGSQPPMWPSWHGNDQITFVSAEGTNLPAAVGQTPRTAFDVIDYRITPQSQLEPVKTLSQDWPVEMKPSMKTADFTAPAPK